MTQGKVLLVEDDDILREATLQALELSGLVVEPFESAARAVRTLSPGFTGCVVSDIRMEGMDGLELFDRIRKLDAEIPVILITGHGDIDMAVRAMRDGAFDFLAKPFSTEHLAGVVRNALHSRRLALDNRALRAALAAPRDELVAQSRSMGLLRAMVSRVAPTEIDVVIEGEAGTGKEIWARELHRQSGRHAQPFIVLPCLGLANELDFPTQTRHATGGTLYVDGCHLLSVADQAQLITLLDARDRGPAGKADPPDFRLIASSPVPLAETGLREELVYRLGAVVLRIPPLRERREDIPNLFAQFAREALDQTGKKRFDMTAADRKRLLEHDWPGNVRELRSYAFGAVLNLPRQAMQPTGEQAGRDLATRVAQYERMVITETLEVTKGSVVRACTLLKTPRKTFYEKLSRHRIDPASFRTRRS